MLANLPSAREPALLEQLDRRAEQEPALGLAAGGGLGDSFDQAAPGGTDLGEGAFEPRSCDPLAAVPLVDKYAGDPPARLGRRVLPVFAAVLESKPGSTDEEQSDALRRGDSGSARPDCG